MNGQTLSHYRILERLGGGGMGVVYKAVDTRLDRTVALKFLPPELTRDDEARQRFILEAKAASTLDHPNICTIHEIDSTPDGQMFIAMAFYEGATLKKRIERGPMPVAEALDIAIQVAQGLVEAHQAGLVHRDIKPANIMLTRSGLVKIVDFGIAKLLAVTGPTQTGTALGTVAYMAPEQIEGDRAEPQTDVWALGAVLYEMLTGQQAFKGESQWAVMNAICTRTLESPSSYRGEISADIDHVVMRALERPRNRRYASAADFLAAAKACQAQMSRPLPTDAFRAGFWRALRTPQVAASVLLVLFVLATIGVWVVNRQEDARWVREAVPEIRRLSEQEEYVSAYLLALRAIEISPENFDVQRAWDSVSFPAQSIHSEPEGAEVYWRGYADPAEDWHYAGRTPIVNTRFPVAYLRWRLTKDRYLGPVR